MTSTFKHKHIDTGTICNGNGIVVFMRNVVRNTNDTKRGWDFTNFIKGKGVNGH